MAKMRKSGVVTGEKRTVQEAPPAPKAAAAEPMDNIDFALSKRASANGGSYKGASEIPAELLKWDSRVFFLYGGEAS